ncbi:MAG TPA: sigma-70 family RNA polymerase sigma factor [Tepidisphaeraceae bacterium]|nr:sigma-70 family RNA polymerase sigma factor [Tepidisphaeraceae bacterium]
MSVTRAPDPHILPPSASRWLDDHGDALYAYALARVRSPEAAEDLVQETLLAGLSAHHRFEGNSAERTWLFGILKHKLLDHLRKAIRQRPLTEIESDVDAEFFSGGGHWKLSVSRWPGDPQQALENAEFHQTLAHCMSKLPSRIAQLFWLREAEGFTTEQLCQELDITATNVWAMLHRARLRLRQCLSVNWFEGDKK